MKKIFFIIALLISNPSFSAGTSSNSSSEANNTDQIKILYQKAEKYIEQDNYKKSLKVLKALTKREDLSGFRADIYNLLGFSYRKLQNPDLEKSFAAYTMALEIDSDHIGALQYLGELYLKLDNKSKALEMLTRLDSLSGNLSEEYLDLKKAIDSY